VADLLPEGMPEQDYARAFLERFGATLDQPAVFEDAIGERLVIGAGLFKDVKGRWKADKNGRGHFLALLAEALREPDEIWVRLEWHYASGKATVRRRYVARFDVDGQESPALLVFEMGPDGWAGVTTFQGGTQTPEDWRVGAALLPAIPPFAPAAPAVAPDALPPALPKPAPPPPAEARLAPPDPNPPP